MMVVVRIGLVFDPLPDAVHKVVRTVRQAVGHQFREILEAGDVSAQGDQMLQSHVLEVVVPGDGNITWVAPDRDVGHPRVERQTVERRVGFDEPSVLLRCEFGEHALDRLRLHVEPGRQSREGTRQVRVSKDQQRTLHLHPRRAALGRCRDDDVAITKLEAVPTPAVHDEVSVPSPHLAHVPPPTTTSSAGTHVSRRSPTPACHRSSDRASGATGSTETRDTVTRPNPPPPGRRCSAAPSRPRPTEAAS